LILIVDNYDSFTFNLVQLVAASGAAHEVVRNDAATVDELLARAPDGILISPGPGRPEEAGVCLPLLARRPALPIFGVCLGHQALGAAFGGVVARAPRPRHGKTSPVRHTGTGLFAGVPNPFEATRYHSLIVARDSLPDELEITARTGDIIMGLRHRTLPIHGVQFHPESIASEHGHKILENFLKIAGEHPTQQKKKAA
jgi:anthranilate synthase/aminodeoxychorismate synthase-like glutamine amidotransferase